MAAGLPDVVDCARLAEESATLERVYTVGELARLRDVVSNGSGTVAARFAFAMLASGRAGARVRVDTIAELECQRCLKGFSTPLSGASEVEFIGRDAPPATDALPGDADREWVETADGCVSLRELAEEELLLALPLAPSCATPRTCGNAPAYATDDAPSTGTVEMRRPFSALSDLLKKT